MSNNISNISSRYNSYSTKNGASNKQKRKDMNTEDTYCIELRVSELEALNKTCGIAIDNLTQKISKHGAESPLGKSAKQDRSSLWNCLVVINEALGEEYDG